MSAVGHVFETLPDRFRPEAAESAEFVISYEIAGEGQFTVRVSQGSASVERDAPPDDPTLTVRTDAETFLGINLGTVDGTQAFMSGKLRIEGDVGLAQKLPRYFTKYVAPQPVTPSAIVASLPERFRPEKAPEGGLSIGYRITGDDGGEWTATIADGSCTVTDGIQGEPTVVQEVSAADFVDIVLGRLDPLTAFGTGRLKVSGDLEAAQAIPRLFRKYEPAGAAKPAELIVLKRNISVDMRYATGPVMGRFLNGLIEKKILANVCSRCSRKQVPPREVCALCRCRADEFVEVGPEGVLVFLDTIYYASPDPLTGKTRETPYGDIRVLLDGCQGTETFWHVLKREDLPNVKRGDRLRPVWAEERSGRIEDIVHFERVDS